MQTLLNKINQTYFLNLLSFLFFVTILVYANTLLNGLFYDDEQFIYNNFSVQHFQINNFFTQSLVTGDGQLSNYYRPLLFLAFSIDYQLFGDSGFIYHFSSMILHGLSGVVLFLFLEKLFKRKDLAFLTSLLWLIHPVQTEAISYASGRGDPLSFFFVVSTLYLSLFQKKKNKIFSILTFTCALLSKEIALIAPLLLFISYLVLQKNLSHTTLNKTIKATLPFFIIACIYFLLRLTILNFANTLNFYGSENLYTQNIFVRVNTFFHLFPEYIKILIFPKTLFIEREVTMNIQTSITPESLLSFFIITSTLILSLWVWIKYKITEFFFGTTWFMLSFLPTMGILPINGIFYEHFLYYPSVGFFFLFAYVLIRITKISTKILQFFYLLLFFLLILLLGIRTIMRNNDWKNPIIFYEQTLTHAKSSRIYNNLAMSYAEKGNSQKALDNYQKAINLSDFYPETHFNMGNTYFSMGKIVKAEAEYKKTIEMNPYFYPAYVNLFRLYQQAANKEGLKWIYDNVNHQIKKDKSFIPLLKQLESLYTN